MKKLTYLRKTNINWFVIQNIRFEVTQIRILRSTLWTMLKENPNFFPAERFNDSLTMDSNIILHVIYMVQMGNVAYRHGNGLYFSCPGQILIILFKKKFRTILESFELRSKKFLNNWHTSFKITLLIYFSSSKANIRSFLFYLTWMIRSTRSSHNSFDYFIACPNS